MSRQWTSILYLLLAGEVIISAFIIFFVLVPMMQGIQADRQTLATVEKNLQTRRQFLETIDRKRVALDGKQTDEQLLAVALPSYDALEDVTRLLHRASQLSGVVIGDIQNTSVTEQRTIATRQAQGDSNPLPANIVPLGIDLSVSGSYQQMRIFIENIERTARLIDIGNFHLQRNTESSEIISASFLLRFYQHTGTASPSP